MEYTAAIMILTLMLIAARVSYGLMKMQNIWKWAVAYWVVLTIKNALDFAGGFFNGF